MAELFHARKGWLRRDFWGSEPDTTNNRMAIRGALAALRHLSEGSRIVFTSDSRYLVDGMISWVHAWAQRGWTRKGGVIENLEQWRELVRTAGRHQIEWRWVKGHALHPQNEYANELAVRAAKEQSASGGLIASGFEAWIAAEQEKKGRYLDFFPTPPEESSFSPSSLPPTD